MSFSLKFIAEHNELTASNRELATLNKYNVKLCDFFPFYVDHRLCYFLITQFNIADIFSIISVFFAKYMNARYLFDQKYIFSFSNKDRKAFSLYGKL